ncbi:MAG: hypothetical protein Q8829_02800, partial [Candidatus Phytoplasma australasiaticum]|nr:hypothetical protein [Candidatus Phytoplasma australasiaticum]
MSRTQDTAKEETTEKSRSQARLPQNQCARTDFLSKQHGRPVISVAAPPRFLPQNPDLVEIEDIKGPCHPGAYEQSRVEKRYLNEP